MLLQRFDEMRSGLTNAHWPSVRNTAPASRGRSRGPAHPCQSVRQPHQPLLPRASSPIEKAPAANDARHFLGRSVISRRIPSTFTSFSVENSTSTSLLLCFLPSRYLDLELRTGRYPRRICSVPSPDTAMSSSLKLTDLVDFDQKTLLSARNPELRLR